MTDIELKFLKMRCGPEVASIRPWTPDYHEGEIRYYVNLKGIHWKFTRADEVARIWFTESNPALQVDLLGEPSEHWVKTVANTHKTITAWFSYRNRVEKLRQGGIQGKK